MLPLKDQSEIDAMRRRLYERGRVDTPMTPHKLTDKPVSVAKTWRSEVIKSSQPELPIDPRPDQSKKPQFVINSETDHKSSMKKRRLHYRAIILLGTLTIFFIVLVGTSLYLLFGSNQISNKNIDVSLRGPLTTGGGEVMPLQLTITNQNKVPIESVILVMNYPAGTKSADDPSKNLFEQRIPLNTIKAGETLKIPVKAIMYGEANQTGEVRASVEYHIQGSNGTFYKDPPPLDFKVSSSPLVMNIDTVNKVSAGQEVDVKLTLKSNTSTPLKNVLLTADYPTNFSYTSANPAPSYRDNSWLIQNIEPGKSTTITIKGLVIGNQDEQFQLQFAAGPPQQDNQFIIGSTLAAGTADFTIEQPFIGVTLSTGGQTGDVVTLPMGDQATVDVAVQNTLLDTLYNMSVEVDVTGNVISKKHIHVHNGFYDSSKNAIFFKVSGDSSLAQVSPSETKHFSFTIIPGRDTKTPSFTLTANAYARRVSDTNVTEQLVGTAKQEAKYTSLVSVTDKVNHANGVFTGTGPIPPVADSKTTYTVTLDVSAGGNNVAGVSVLTSLPQYVQWENNTAGDGTIIFNPVTHGITWTVGNIDAGKTKEMNFQISMIPSQNQIGTTPALVGKVQLRATDLFTNSVIRADASPLSAELSDESGYTKNNGKVANSLSLLSATTSTSN